MNEAAQLAAGIGSLSLDISPAIQRKLLEYLALIKKWNRVYNLTALQDPAQMVKVHLLDSLAVAPHLNANTIVDVGSGAGLPGIPLALARPHSHITLLDSNQKKAAFLKQATIELKMNNAEVVCIRAETWQPGKAFEVVLSRAFSELSEFVRLAGHLCGVGGVMAAMKGLYPQAEIERLPAENKPVTVIPLDVPGLGAERHLVLFPPRA